MMQKICRKCWKLFEDVNICPNCGAVLEEATLSDQLRAFEMEAMRAMEKSSKQDDNKR